MMHSSNRTELCTLSNPWHGQRTKVRKNKQSAPVLLADTKLRTLFKVWSLIIKLLKDFCYV